MFQEVRRLTISGENSGKIIAEIITRSYDVHMYVCMFVRFAFSLCVRRVAIYRFVHLCVLSLTVRIRENPRITE